MLHGPQSAHAGRFKLALVQMAVGADKAANVRRACRMVKEAVQHGAGMVVLPVRGWGVRWYHSEAVCFGAYFVLG